MRSVGELMNELGFRQEGSDDTKKAFIINLIRAANIQAPVPISTHQYHNHTPASIEASPETSSRPDDSAKTTAVRAVVAVREEQLSFQFDDQFENEAS